MSFERCVYINYTDTDLQLTYLKFNINIIGYFAINFEYILAKLAFLGIERISPSDNNQ